MNERVAAARREFTVWVSHAPKCLSFHPEPGYEALSYTDGREMWRSVQEFIRNNYLIR